jgi:thioredoxin-like negative regulator of GroEL
MLAFSKFAAFFAGLVFAAGSLVAATPETKASKEQDYSVAFRDAQETGKPLLVLIGTDWCPGCVKMKSEVIPQIKGSTTMEQVKFAQVNADDDEKLAGQLLTGTSIPQLVMYVKTGSGWKRHNLTGPKSVSEVESFINSHVEKPIIRFSSAKK